MIATFEEKNHMLSNTCDNFALFPLEIVGIDWLSISYKMNVEYIDKFKLIPTERQTSIFKNHAFLEYKNVKYAEITYFPRMKHIDPNLMILRILNEHLYNSDFVGFIKIFESQKGCIFNNYNRVDFFTDFTKLNHELSVNKFFSLYNKEKICKKGKGYVNIISPASDVNAIETLRFGRKSSKLSFILYNKRKELEAKENKLYIQDIWKQCGINSTQDVYRLEFNLMRKNLQFLVPEIYEPVDFDIYRLNDKKYVAGVLAGLVNRYFSFLEVNKKVSREYYKNFNCIDTNEYEVKSYFSRDDRKTNRADRIFLKKLIRQKKDYELMQDNLAFSCQMLISDFVKAKGLEEYYLKIYDFV